MARVHRQLVAVLDAAADLVDVGEVEAGRHALRVQVERDVDEVDVAGALAVAEQAAFDAVGAGHQRELAGRGAGAAVVVRVHRQHDARRAARGGGASTRSCRRRCSACECSTVDGRLMMHLRSGVGCQTSVTASTTRLENASSVPENISGEYWKVQLRRRLLRGQLAEHARMAWSPARRCRPRPGPAPRGASPARWRCTGARSRAARRAATRRCAGSAGSRACVSTWIVTSSGMQVLARSACARSRTRSATPTGKPTSISLKPIATSVSNMRSLRAMSIGSISAWLPSRRSTLQPDRRAASARRRARCGPCRRDRGEGAVLAAGLLQHGGSLGELDRNQQPQKQTARCWLRYGPLDRERVDVGDQRRPWGLLVVA